LRVVYHPAIGGYNLARLNACGYSLSTVFTPIRMDTPILYNANPVLAAQGKTLVTEAGNQRLSAASLGLRMA
jgi:hypothetical protein